MVIFIYQRADQQRDGLKIFMVIFVPTATARAFPHLDKVLVAVHQGRTAKLLYVAEAATYSVCTFHEVLYITAYYSNAVFTLT
jgi:hypothetical protein